MKQNLSKAAMIAEIHKSSLNKSQEVKKLDQDILARSKNRKMWMFCKFVPEDGGHQCNYYTSDNDLFEKHLRHHEKNCTKGFIKCALKCSLNVAVNCAPQHLDKCHGVVFCTMSRGDKQD